MVPWIQVYSNLLTHDKTYSLAERLKIQNYSAAGIMVGLWCWAAVNAPDGDITGYPPNAISDAVKWNKKARTLYDALLEVRLLEEVEDGRVVIRNWENYADLLINMMETQKSKTKDRVKRYRQRKKTLEDTMGNATGNGDCNVTETLCNASTEPNITIHNNTISNYGDDDDLNNICITRAREPVDNVNIVDSVDSVDNHTDIPSGLKQIVRQLAGRYFERFFGREPSPEDVRWVWDKVREEDENGQWKLSQGRTEVMEYVLQEAAKANAMSIGYMNGIYRNLYQRGLTTAEDIAGYDFERDRALGKV